MSNFLSEFLLNIITLVTIAPATQQDWDYYLDNLFFLYPNYIFIGLMCYMQGLPHVIIGNDQGTYFYTCYLNYLTSPGYFVVNMIEYA